MNKKIYAICLICNVTLLIVNIAMMNKAGILAGIIGSAFSAFSLGCEQ